MDWSLFFTICAQVGIATLVVSVCVVILGSALSTAWKSRNGTDAPNKEPRG